MKPRVMRPMSTLKFNINWDYRCPYARIVNEHVVAGLNAGADWEVEFIPFSLTAVHTEEDEPPCWEDPDKANELLAVQVGIVAAEKFPETFNNLHVLLFDQRHEFGRDIRSKAVLENAVGEAGLDPSVVFAEIDSGWPLKEFRRQHESSVERYNTFGVPTIFVEDKAAFVRLLATPDDATKSIDYIEHLVGLIADESEINELKHTTIPR